MNIVTSNKPGDTGPTTSNLAKRVYICDDKPANYEALKLVIEEALPQCRVKYASSGTEVISMVAKRKPDLILMDVVMPGMDGVEATIEIRKKHSKKSLPIIAMTAQDVPEDKDRVIKAGCNEYLSKPFQVSELMEKVHFYLGL
jgi:CheY-like chemotaxis protein